jgi:dihydroflavonol-4-reductase
MTVVVTGASGHLGGTLVRTLLAQGQPVRALVHQDRRAVAGLDVEVVVGDVTSPESLRRAFARAQVVYHAAGYISLLRHDWRRSDEVNVVGTRNVVQACLECDVQRLIHFSSIHALDLEACAQAIDETCPLVDGPPHPPYDRSKAAGEAVVQKAIAGGLDAVVLNPTAIVGPYDFRPSHVGAALLKLAEGRIPGLIAGGFDWVDVRDVALGALREAEHAPAGAKYLLGGHWVTVRDLAETVAGHSGVRAPWFTSPLLLARLFAPAATLYAQITRTMPIYTSVSLRALSREFRVSHERATQELGYAPRPFSDTICDTLSWFQDAGLLPASPRDWHDE